MRLNILIGGKAGQGINKVSEIVASTLKNYGYFTFNYRDYQSLIRGGHNFNILSISDNWIASHESVIDILVALDKNTIELHKKELKKQAIILDSEEYKELGKNENIAVAGELIKILGIEKQALLEEIKREFNNQEAIKAAELGFEKQKQKFNLKKLNNKIRILTGSNGIVQGAINSNLDLYIAYPMTPATGVLHELAARQLKEKKKFLVFEPENEIAGINMALGASFSGAIAMTGSSGGGFDLMTESLSLSGQAEIPLVVYLATRPGPSTGVPTYTSQDDLMLAVNSGHGEFPKVVVAPGDPIECIEKTNEAFYFAEKYHCPVIILSDKHLAESEFSINKQENKTIPIKVLRKIPGKDIVKANSYEHQDTMQAETAEDAETAIIGAKRRIETYNKIKKEIENFQAIKIHGNKSSKNLIIGFGSTKGAILDSIKDLDCKFLQVLYIKPMSSKIRQHMQDAKNVILVENNATGQLGRLIREKTGIKIEEKNRILKHDGRPFTSDELNLEIKKRLR